MRRICCALVVMSSLTACTVPTALEFQQIETLHVAAFKVPCTPWYGPDVCLEVRSDPAGRWTLLYDEIVGFSHEEGFEYELRIVRFRVRNPPADGSSRELRLARVVRRVPAPPAYR